jgi:hypothetical protein
VPPWMMKAPKSGKLPATPYNGSRTKGPFAVPSADRVWVGKAAPTLCYNCNKVWGAALPGFVSAWRERWVHSLAYDPFLGRTTESHPSHRVFESAHCSPTFHHASGQGSPSNSHFEERGSVSRSKVRTLEGAGHCRGAGSGGAGHVRTTERLGAFRTR